MKNDGKLRLLRLLELLRDESSPEHPITTAQLERLLKERWGMESYRITIQNDIAALVSAVTALKRSNHLRINTSYPTASSSFPS